MCVPVREYGRGRGDEVEFRVCCRWPRTHIVFGLGSLDRYVNGVVVSYLPVLAPLTAVLSRNVHQ